MTFNIVTCGVGGQGLMLISNILGVACTEIGLNIKTAETHGLAQRSGSIYTHIRIGAKIYSSLIPYGEAHIVLGMEAIETLRNIEFLEENGIIILNDYIWYPVQSTFERVQDDSCSYITIDQIIEQLKKITSRIHLINALDLANQAGNPLTSNMVLLGALVKINKFPIPFEKLESIIPQVVPEKAVGANLKALKLGYQAINI